MSTKSIVIPLTESYILLKIISESSDLWNTVNPVNCKQKNKEIKDNCNLACCGVCPNTLIHHCCKHVVAGNDSEKENFMNATNCDVTASNKITGTDDPVVSAYRELSENVLRTATVFGVSGVGNDEFTCNIFCQGAGKTNRFVDYCTSDKISELNSIVSCYMSDVDTLSYYFFLLLAAEEDVVNKACLPLVEVEGESVGISDDVIWMLDKISEGIRVLKEKKNRKKYPIGSIFLYYNYKDSRVSGTGESIVNQMSGWKDSMTFKFGTEDQGKYIKEHNDELIDWFICEYIQRRWGDKQRTSKFGYEGVADNDKELFGMVALNTLARLLFQTKKHYTGEALTAVVDRIKNLSGNLKTDIGDFTSFYIASSLAYMYVMKYIAKAYSKDEKHINELSNQIEVLRNEVLGKGYLSIDNWWKKLETFFCIEK